MEPSEQQAREKAETEIATLREQLVQTSDLLEQSAREAGAYRSQLEAEQRERQSLQVQLNDARDSLAQVTATGERLMAERDQWAARANEAGQLLAQMRSQIDALLPPTSTETELLNEIRAVLQRRL